MKIEIQDQQEYESIVRELYWAGQGIDPKTKEQLTDMVYSLKSEIAFKYLNPMARNPYTNNALNMSEVLVEAPPEIVDHVKHIIMKLRADKL